jgi:radical SAM protein with 4Fe4S-binding SPASM domain
MKHNKYLRKINFGIFEKSCNLKCPKCLVYGESFARGREIRKSLGKMNIENIINVFEEIKDFPIMPFVSPSFWSEPLVSKKLFIRFVEEAQKRNIPVSINTNALLIDDEMAEFLVVNLSSISISIDATTSDTLLKVRSTKKIEQIENAVILLLDKRGTKLNPRITVSFTEEIDNIHEKEEFIEKWIEKVDSIRINKVYSDKKQVTVESSEDNRIIPRMPCREIYDSMTIDFDGTSRMCCLDGYRETNLGNVFSNSVVDVWNSSKMNNLRRSHEDKNIPIDSFCESCEQWAGFNIINEYEKDGLLIRETAFSNYYNRIDRLGNWQESKRIDLN